MRTIATITAAVTCAGALALPAAAQASGGGTEVRRAGSCSAAADWDLRAKQRDGRIEVEFEVDSNRVGQRWNWRLLRNGTSFATGVGVTVAPSGSFSVERRTGDGAGSETIAARATNPVTGETCRASLSI